jgi:hypothetical protein
MVLGLIEFWHWCDLKQAYGFYQTRVRELEGAKQRCSIPESIHTDYSDQANSMILRFNYDLRHYGQKLLIVEQEIARRFGMIGNFR